MDVLWYEYMPEPAYSCISAYCIRNGGTKPTNKCKHIVHF